MQYAIWSGLFLPLAGFLVLLISAFRIKRSFAGILACTTIFLSFLCFSTLLLMYNHTGGTPVTFVLYPWIPIEGIQADVSLRLDSLSLLMTLIITGVGFLIHVYSIGYMQHDEDFARYFACLNFFVFAMLLLVLAANLPLLFVGWEGVGLASYLLIGFWYSRPAAARAATKAFVVNRVGDLGLLVGLLLTFYIFRTGDIATVIDHAGHEFPVGAPILTVLTILYFIGATGKSAQLPLHTWLPDAMEGPTPVSALIHAATMVTAGVYLVVRMHPVFMQSPTTLFIIGAIGAVTSLFAALCALGQTDLKRVLAYSTVSQLGLMFMACGIGAFFTAMFHLTTHAFIKALLFLSAGNVVHMMHDTTEMEKMGGLSKYFPQTQWMFLIGVLAMAGIPPLAAFFSKDLILEQEHLAGFDILFYIGMTASILTGIYLIRAYFLTFRGSSHVEGDISETIKEAPKVMLVPVFLLAILSICGGFLGFSFNETPILERFLAELGLTPIEKNLNTSFLFEPATLLSVVGALIGIGVTAALYTRFADKLGSPLTILRKSFFIDEIYWGAIVFPLRSIAQFIAAILEPKFFDGLIRFATQTVQVFAYGLQRLQSGAIRSYVAWMVVGTVILIAYFAF